MTARVEKKAPILDALAPLFDDRAPRCSSWRGHRFEGRFDDYRGLGNREVETRNHTPAEFRELVTAMQQRRIYVRDICVRCGYVIERARG